MTELYSYSLPPLPTLACYERPLPLLDYIELLSYLFKSTGNHQGDLSENMHFKPPVFSQYNH